MGMHIANLAFRPLEGRSGFVVRGYESVDCLSNLLGRGETYPSQSATTQDAEPAFNLIEPTGVGGRKVQMDRRMLPQPTVMLGFVGIEIVHHYVQFPARIECDHLVHEAKKIAASTPVSVSARDLAAEHIQGGEQGGRAVAFVLMTETGHRFAVG